MLLTLKVWGFRPSHDQGYGCRHTFLNWFYLSQWGRETACGQGESAFYNTFSKKCRLKMYQEGSTLVSLPKFTLSTITHIFSKAGVAKWQKHVLYQRGQRTMMLVRQENVKVYRHSRKRNCLNLLSFHYERYCYSYHSVKLIQQNIKPNSNNTIIFIITGLFNYL